MSRRLAVRWAGYIAFAVAFAVACGFLADWQFTRNADRERQLTLVAQNYDATPVALAEVISVGTAFDPDDQWRPVALVGQYLTDEQLLVRNRAHGGTSAFEVLTPFRTEDGRVVIVDRGWVAPGESQLEPDAIPAPPEGVVTVVARLMPSEPLPRSGRAATEGQVPTINVAAIADTIPSGAAALTDVYVVMASESPAPAERPHPLASPSEDPGPHLSYAIQWILFAVMGFIFIWYMIRTERRHRLDDAAEAVEQTPTVRRRDRDMADEDALIEAAAGR